VRFAPLLPWACNEILGVLELTLKSHKHMRDVFVRMENNNYLPKNTPGHGFDGWFETNMNDGTQNKLRPGMVEVMKSEVKVLGDDPDKIIEYLGRDGNYQSDTRAHDTGMFGLVFHATAGWERWSPRTYILETLGAKKEDGSQKYPLTLSTRSFATKLLYGGDKDEKCKGSHKPCVVGVSYLNGEAIYKADARNTGANAGVPKSAFARKDVIVAGGTFNSPQLLQLSGIGDRKHLESLNITVRAHRPGVGANLMDNQELPVVGHAQKAIEMLAAPGDPTCTPGVPSDPCLLLLRENNTGPYARQSVNANALLLQTKHAVRGERDIFIFTLPAAFRGFWPAAAQQPELFGDPPTTVGLSMVKINPQSHAGYVRIASADPAAPPDINFEYYADGAETDIGALRDAVAFGRTVFGGVAAPYGPLEPVEPPCSGKPDGNGYCAGDDEEWIRDQTFGHHPTGTCKMGKADDEMAVVDSEFRVIGVQGLRIVDASIFPETPGPFPVVATAIISQKASDVILKRVKGE
jgi:choline dehydrogenase